MYSHIDVVEHNGCSFNFVIALGNNVKNESCWIAVTMQTHQQAESIIIWQVITLLNWSLCVLNYFKKEMIYYTYIDIKKNRDYVYGWWQYKLLIRNGAIWGEKSFDARRLKSSAVVLFDQQHVQINNVENTNSTSLLTVCEGSPPVTDGFPHKMECISISWLRHVHEWSCGNLIRNYRRQGNPKNVDTESRGLMLCMKWNIPYIRVSVKSNWNRLEAVLMKVTFHMHNNKRQEH